MKTTAPKLFTVMPAHGVIRPNQTQDIQGTATPRVSAMWSVRHPITLPQSCSTATIGRQSRGDSQPKPIVSALTEAALVEHRQISGRRDADVARHVLLAGASELPRHAFRRVAGPAASLVRVVQSVVEGRRVRAWDDSQRPAVRVQRVEIESEPASGGIVVGRVVLFGGVGLAERDCAQV